MIIQISITETQISPRLGFIERSPNINFQEIVSDRIWINETHSAINEELKF